MIFTPGLDQPVGDRLSRRRRARRARRRRRPPPRRPRSSSSKARTSRPPTCLPISFGIDVEHRDDPEAVVGEDVGAGDRLAEVAGAEQGDVVLARGAQDLADLGDQRVDVVADAALAELAEAGEVAADLGRVDVGVVGELLRGDRVLAHLPGLGQDLEVAREPRRDAEREPVAVGREVRGRCRGRSVGAPRRSIIRDKVSSRARRRVRVEAELARRPRRRRSTTGIRSRSAPCSSVVALDVDLAQLEARARRARSALELATRASSQRWQPGRA